MAGGLGARITHLTRTLAGMGYQIHHFFIGDPDKEGRETQSDGRIVLHRWCQWISRHHPGGVYDGEEGKLNDFIQSVPPFALNEIIKPALREDKLVVVLSEEWQTAETLCRLGDLLWNEGLRNRVVLFWNANNTYSFERIDWTRLKRSATLTTVSKYMKQIMLKMGMNPLVIYNGIESSLLREVSDRAVAKVRERLNGDLILSKVARWHRDKGWEPAIETVYRLKRAGRRPLLLARGSMEDYGEKITREAGDFGLKVSHVTLNGNSKECYDNATQRGQFKHYYDALSSADLGDILNLTFPIPHCFLRTIYKASHVVLANSVHEPFGLVGLEAMATGALVFTGCSGEDYANHLNNAIVLDTFSADEIEYYINFLQNRPDLKKAIRIAARRTARRWVWEEVVKELICKLEYTARVQGINLGPPRVEDHTASHGA
jgi:glycosyltransferase involved in cell wall biosynthesis